MEAQSGSPMLRRSLKPSLVGVVYVAKREYQRLAFSATPFPADTILVLNTSSVGVSRVSRAKVEEDGDGEARLTLSALSLYGLGRGLGLGVVLELRRGGDDHRRRREADSEGEGGWKVQERGTPVVLRGELWGRLALRGAEQEDGCRRRGLAGSCRSRLGVRLLSGLPRWFMYSSISLARCRRALGVLTSSLSSSGSSLCCSDWDSATRRDRGS